MNNPLLVFSHLRWNFVFQRPQHLLSRLAHERPVYFIEEPMLASDRPPRWGFTRHQSQLTVCCPRTPLAEPGGFSNEQMPYLEMLLAELLETEQLSDYIAWFYTPMAWPLARNLKPQAIVYDCMDELSQFRGAPREMLERETELLAHADVVFTGGPSLYRSKKERHPEVRCFPSSVDAAHFGQAKQQLAEPDDQRLLPHPRLGYFGVIDERLDLALLDKMAAAEPDWQIVMVGPVVKIDPATLPRQPNIHYLGQKSYQELPAYLSGWDVCLLPFARNEATEFISPTKTLEYMAAEKPIVSTPITDVAEPYGEIVYLGSTPEEFIAACRHALEAPAAESQQRRQAMRDVLEKTSWDKTVRAMSQELKAATERRRQRSRKQVGPPGNNITGAGVNSIKKERSAPVVVIGAGPTGLSAAYHLGADSLLVERQQQIGGLCRSVYDKGFTYDLAGHIMFSQDAYVHEMYKMLLGDNVHWQNREAWIYSKEVYTRYPFQGCLYGLPADVITECIVGAIEARFGPLKEQPAMSEGAKVAEGKSGNGHLTKGAVSQKQAKPADTTNGKSLGGNVKACRTDKTADKNDNVEDCCGDGIMEAEVPLSVDTSPPGTAKRREPRNFEEFIYQVWGQGIAKHFAIPYNRKLWAVPLTEMETSWLGGRVPMPDLEEMIRYALTPAAKPMGPNARFGYPLHGGFQALMDGFLPHLEGELLLGAPIVEVSPSQKTVTTADGQQIDYQVLISTMPLPILVRAMGDEAPPEVHRAVNGLRYVSVRCVHLGVGREKLTEKHWIYYPEDTVFHRIFVQGNASPHCNPAGGFGLTCEITYSPSKPLPCDGDELIERCIADCHRVKMFHPEDEVWSALQVDLPFAYVVYDHQRRENVATIRRWLAKHDILLAGRYSEWEYYNSDHAFLAGRNAADAARKILRQQTVGTKAGV